jgi:transcriptional regulator with XRE-family HTH domain
VRVIDRLERFWESKNFKLRQFEKICGIANGYLGKQLKGRGSVGTDILQRIHDQFPELNLFWVITGKGTMLISPDLHKKEMDDLQLQEEDAVYQTKSKMVSILREQLDALENAFPEKKKKRSKKSSTD